MIRTKFFAMIAGALVAGIVLGSVASGYAATGNGGSGSSPVSAVAGLGLRLGSAVHDGGGRLLDVVAKLTGKTTADVTAERQAGKTFAQIAAEKGVAQAAVVDSALKVRQDVLSAKVNSGAITQPQADTALSTMKTRLSDRVTSTGTTCGGGGRGCGAGNGGGCAGCANGAK